MKNLIGRVLLKLSPEVAHHQVIRLLKAYQLIPVPLKFPAIEVRTMPHLKFRNRVGLAAGFDKNAEVFPALARLGFGFLEVGTVTPLPQPGNPKPRIWRVPPAALVNSLGFNNCGLEQFARNLSAHKSPIPVFANIGKGKATPNEAAIEDYQFALRHLRDRANGFVINVSSPNTPGLRGLQNPEFIEQLGESLPIGRPVWLKLAPDLANEDLKTLCEQVKRHSRINGVVVTNTSRALAQASGYDQGGLSGAPLLERSLECVTIAREALGPEKILVGVGGISSRRDARLMHEAGADLIEIYTSFIYQGPGIVAELADELKR